MVEITERQAQHYGELVGKTQTAILLLTMAREHLKAVRDHEASELVASIDAWLAGAMAQSSEGT